MARFIRRDGLLLRVGSKRWKWWMRNRLRMMGRMPLVTKRRRVVMIAKWAARQPGAATSYLYGGVPGIGTGTHTDCSGFCVAVFGRVGVHLPRTSQMQFASALTHPEHARPGDLLFFNYEGPHSHVGIKIGPDTMIGDQHTGSGIVRVTIDRAHLDGTGSYLP
jgi:cell wall-associated NlpC family hydrolase